MANLVDLRDKKLKFIREQYIYKLEYFKTSNMSIDTLCYKKDDFIRKENIPFAQLPKQLKKIVKPN